MIKPTLAECSIVTTTLVPALATRSIAPPMPFTILPWREHTKKMLQEMSNTHMSFKIHYYVTNTEYFKLCETIQMKSYSGLCVLVQFKVDIKAWSGLFWRRFERALLLGNHKPDYLWRESLNKRAFSVTLILLFFHKHAWMQTQTQSGHTDAKKSSRSICVNTTSDNDTCFVPYRFCFGFECINTTFPAVPEATH